MSAVGYWPSPWPGEDGGPHRPGAPPAGAPTPDLTTDPDAVEVTARDVIAATMVVLRDPGEVFLLGHTFGPHATAWVERVDPVTLAPLARSADLPGGPAWPGGIAAHADGSLRVVFGNHAHRLDPALDVRASATLPRHRPYNSFVVLPDGHLVTKDFAGRLPGDTGPPVDEPAELLVLHPESLAIVARATAPEPSVARISALDDTVYVVGTHGLHRFDWDGARLRHDPDFAPVYRTRPGQTYGWDATIALGAAWFLDDGEGSERFAGSFRGLGISEAPLQLVRVGLEDGAVSSTEIFGRPGGLIANPPVVDPMRRIVIGYDSANAVVAAFDVAPDGSTRPRWSRTQDHACHPLILPERGVVVTDDHDAERGMDQVVVLDVETGAERLRVDSGSPWQSVLFPAVGFADDIYLCSFTTLTRVAARR